MEEYVGLPLPDFCYPAVEADLELVELPSGMWTYKKSDGTLADAHYRDSAGALGAGLREELKLVIVYKFRFQREGVS